MSSQPDDGHPSAQELHTELSRELSLPDESQDWGIVNADGGRLEEFVTFLCGHDLAPTQVFDVVELILASANERLLDDATYDLSMVAEVLDRYPGAASVHCDYWRGLHDPSEYPVSRWLRDSYSSLQGRLWVLVTPISASKRDTGQLVRLLPGPVGVRGPVEFRIKGNDVVVTTPDGSFVTILKDGVNNESVRRALGE